MRDKKRTMHLVQKQEEREKRMRKWLFVLASLLLIFGITIVDQSYSEMMDAEGKIVPTFRRVDDERLAISVFGNRYEVNTQEIENTIQEIKRSILP